MTPFTTDWVARVVKRGIADPDDWREAVIDQIPALRAFGLSLSRNWSDADDLVQETLLKAWAARRTFVAGSNMKAWLFTILRNAWYSAAVKRRRELIDEDGRHAAAVACEGNQQPRVELLALLAALDRLPPEYREAVVLVGAAGLSYQEAADVAALPLGTLKSRVRRGRERLVRLLDPGTSA